MQIENVQLVGAIQLRAESARRSDFSCRTFLANNRHAKYYFQNTSEWQINFRTQLELAVSQLLNDDRLEDALRFITDFDVLAVRLALEPSIAGILRDLKALESRLGRVEAQDVHCIRRAMQLASSVLSNATDQLPEQVLARLKPDEAQPRVRKLLQRAELYKTQPWLKPLHVSLQSPEGPLQEKFDFYGELIAAASFDTKSNRLWTASDSHLVGWELDSGKVAVRFRARDSSPTAVVCNSPYVVLTTRQGEVFVFDAVKGCMLGILEASQRAICGAAFVCGSQLAIVGMDGWIRLLDVRECKQIGSFSTGEQSLHCVVPLDAARVAVGCARWEQNSQPIQIWDVELGTLNASFGQHAWPVDCLAIDTAGTTLAAGANDELTIWRIADGSCMRRIAIPNSKCHALTFVSPTLLISGDSSGELRCWDTVSGAEIRRLSAHSGLVSALATATSGQQLVSTSWDQSIRVWATDRLATAPRLEHQEQVTCLASYAGESRVVSGSQDGKLIVWDVEHGIAAAICTGHTHWVSGVSVKTVIVSASWDGTIRLWDAATGDDLQEIATGDKHVIHLACSADGTVAATVSSGSLIRIWDLCSAKQLTSVETFQENIRGLEFVGNERLRWATQSRQVFEWDMAEQPVQVTTITGTVPATCWDLSIRMGNSVLGGADGKILLFDDNGKVTAEFGVPGCAPSTIVRSEDGELVLATFGLPQLASDNTVRLWRTRDLQRPLAEFITDSPLTAASLSRTGRRAIVGDASGAVHFLDGSNL